MSTHNVCFGAKIRKLGTPVNPMQLLVKTENEKRRFVMKVRAFCEEKGLRSVLGVFGYAESKNQCWQAEKWLLHHLICIFPR